MFGNKFIDIATHLLHIGALSGCAHFLVQGETLKALECAYVGSLCIVMLASAEVFANLIRGK